MGGLLVFDIRVLGFCFHSDVAHYYTPFDVAFRPPISDLWVWHLHIVD